MSLIVLLLFWVVCGLIAAWQRHQKFRAEGYKPGTWYRLIVLSSLIGGPLVFVLRAIFNHK